jgi:hypothetical protein
MVLRGAPVVRVLLELREPKANGGDERFQIAEVVCQDVPHDREIDVVVAVDQDVPKTGHVAERVGELRRDPAVSLQTLEELHGRHIVAGTEDGFHSLLQRGVHGAIIALWARRRI